MNDLIWFNAILLATNVIFLWLNGKEQKNLHQFFKVNADAAITITLHYKILHELNNECQATAALLKKRIDQLEDAPQIPDLQVPLTRLEKTQNGIRVHP